MAQTFIIHPDYTINARLLDFARLNKQISLGFLIYRTCTKINSYIKCEPQNIIDYILTAKKVAKEHKIQSGTQPAVLMWLGYEDSLAQYIEACYTEWTTNRRRKNGDLCTYKHKPPEIKNATPPMKPWWIYYSNLIILHRVALLRKDPNYYGKIKIFQDLNQKDIEYFSKKGYIWPYRKIT